MNRDTAAQEWSPITLTRNQEQQHNNKTSKSATRIPSSADFWLAHFSSSDKKRKNKFTGGGTNEKQAKQVNITTGVIGKNQAMKGPIFYDNDIMNS